jgi:guanylate kinase
MKNKSLLDSSNYLFCVLGRSGSGKDTLVDELIKRHPEWVKLISKTTRNKRFPEENTHVFSTHEEYLREKEAGKVVAYTNYNGNEYWATTDQIENSFFYVLDPVGLEQLKREYKGKKKIISIGLSICSSVSLGRMRKRGDNEKSISERLALDETAFKDLSQIVDMYVKADEFESKKLADYIENIIYFYLSFSH